MRTHAAACLTQRKQYYGFSFIDFPIIGKCIGMLKDVSPNVSRVALMFDPDHHTMTCICGRSNVEN